MLGRAALPRPSPPSTRRTFLIASLRGADATLISRMDSRDAHRYQIAFSDDSPTSELYIRAFSRTRLIVPASRVDGASIWFEHDGDTCRVILKHATAPNTYIVTRADAYRLATTLYQNAPKRQRTRVRARACATPELNSTCHRSPVTITAEAILPSTRVKRATHLVLHQNDKDPVEMGVIDERDARRLASPRSRCAPAPNILSSRTHRNTPFPKALCHHPAIIHESPEDTQ